MDPPHPTPVRKLSRLVGVWGLNAQWWVVDGCIHRGPWALTDCDDTQPPAGLRNVSDVPHPWLAMSKEGCEQASNNHWPTGCIPWSAWPDLLVW
jgi:hypothetical protein